MSGESDSRDETPMLSDEIGVRLRFVRERAGLSQRELARRGGVTNGTLSNIEQGKVSPSIASLEKILAAVPMSMQEFFSEDLELSPPVFKEEQLVQIHKDGTDYRILPFAEGSRSGNYLARQSYSPGAKVSSEWMVYSGTVAGLLVEGELELVLEGVEYRLVTGDGFCFSIQRPHSFKNVSSANCVVVSVSLAD
ncbi:helix-turn-helix domain-containing protein [Agaribacterium haliotis]|uniref:helix-turn-helix domain-containing protein n=1 Tax=Agaribacterium haliotis TaxID=2013869 RepID=UPI000BB59F1D|nr:helix-turn-helix domain-containing protein [Agaribacterium haliotis]